MKLSFLLSVITVLGIMSSPVQCASMPLKLLSPLSSGRCMDGTVGGYYFQNASSPANANKWVFMMQGGGECTTKSTCAAVMKASPALASSSAWPRSIDFDDVNGLYYASDSTANKDFSTWNHVFLPYCSQDVFSGTNTVANDWGVYFSGHLLFVDILDELVAKHSLSDASHIILSGASAGGIATWMNLDYLADRFPNSRTVGAPVAGFYFFAYPYTGVNHTSSGLADFRPEAWPATYALWKAYVNPACKAALQPLQLESSCLLSNYSFPFVKSESFATEAQTDEVVLTAHDWLPYEYRNEAPEREYMRAWHKNMTQALAPLMDLSNKRNGAFNPACFIHTTFTPSKPLINGISYIEAFGNWYFQRTSPNQYKLADDCGIECNPTCP